MAVSSIFFIDDRVQDKEALFSAIDASAKWFVLDSSLDGISQMQRILSSYRNLDSIQIISHGSTGAINIGSTVLNSTNLPYYQTQLQTIGSSLKETGDLLLYGCDVAKGDEGQKFMTDLAKVTGAHVTTSNDLIGRLILSENLPSEISTGHIETVTIQPAVFNYVVTAETIEETITNDTSTSGHDVGNVTGYIHTSTTIYADGYASSWTNHYDTKWTVTESAFTDSSGNKSVTQYQTNTDADGNVTGYTHITTSTDTSGNSSSSTNNYDTKWTLTGSGFTYISGNTSNSIDANNDGIIGALSSIELNVSEATGKEIVPVICICWDEDNPYYSIPKDIALIAVTDENITSKSISEGFTIDTLNADPNYSTLISDIGNGQSRDAGNDVLAFNSTTASNIDAIVDFVMATDNIHINNSIFADSEITESLSANLLRLDAGLDKNQFFNDQDINSSVADTPYYDRDGSFSGAPVQIAILGTSTHPTTAYTDFSVIA